MNRTARTILEIIAGHWAGSDAATIATRTGLTIGTVYRHTAALRRAGLIVVAHRFHSGMVTHEATDAGRAAL